MHKISISLFVMISSCLSLYSQDSGTTMAGDWIRIRAEYKDGDGSPMDHGSRIFIRYHFTSKEVYQVFSENTLPSAYTRTGNTLRIEPVQVFKIQEYTNKALTLVETNGQLPIRFYFISKDSFQIAGKIKYVYEVVNNDTIYSIAPGIEPIYTKGQSEFMRTIITGFSQKAAFEFTYIVKNDGTIGDVTIKAATNPKLNKRLVQLVKKTSGKWIPATNRGKPINVKLNASIALNRGS